VDERVGRSLMEKAARRGSETERTVTRARELRDAAHRVFVDVAHGRTASPTDLAVVYAALARAVEHGSIVQTGDGFVWRWQDGAEALDSMLWPIARSAAELLTGTELPRVRECGGECCGWLFLDQTKNRTRRWCEMKVCTVTAARPPTRPSNRAMFRRGLALVLLAVAFGAAPADAGCDDPPAPGVDWNLCLKARASLAGAQLADANFKHAKMAGTNLTGADLAGADLSGATMQNTSFKSASLRKANLSAAFMGGADFTDAVLADASLDGTNLPGATLMRADLRGADLTGAYLVGADLQDAKLDGAKLDDAVLVRARWTNGRICATGSVGRCIEEE
jgi:predicted RNA-binding Zn ribbon-like protein